MDDVFSQIDSSRFEFGGLNDVEVMDRINAEEEDLEQRYNERMNALNELEREQNLLMLQSSLWRALRGKITFMSFRYEMFGELKCYICLAPIQSGRRTVILACKCRGVFFEGHYLEHCNNAFRSGNKVECPQCRSDQTSLTTFEL